MDAKEVTKRMKEFGLRGVLDGSAHLFIKPELLAEFVQHEILAEREECAKLCDANESFTPKDAWQSGVVDTRKHLAAAIRMRSNVGDNPPQPGR